MSSGSGRSQDRNELRLGKIGRSEGAKAQERSRQRSGFRPRKVKRPEGVSVQEGREIGRSFGSGRWKDRKEYGSERTGNRNGSRLRKMERPEGGRLRKIGGQQVTSVTEDPRYQKVRAGWSERRTGCEPRKPATYAGENQRSREPKDVDK